MIGRGSSTGSSCISPARLRGQHRRCGVHRVRRVLHRAAEVLIAGGGDDDAAGDLVGSGRRGQGADDDVGDAVAVECGPEEANVSLKAASKLLPLHQDHSGSPLSYRYLAACHAHMGRLDQARASRRATARHHPRHAERRQLCATPSTAVCSVCRVCAVAMGEAALSQTAPSRRDPRRRCGGLFAADGGG